MEISSRILAAAALQEFFVTGLYFNSAPKSEQLSARQPKTMNIGKNRIYLPKSRQKIIVTEPVVAFQAEFVYELKTIRIQIRIEKK